MNLEEQIQKFSKIQFIAFREDVFDRFNSIIKSINDDNINTQFDYNDNIKELHKDFKLYTIIKFINNLANDNEFKKHHHNYKIALTYCDEIMENNIIKNIFTQKKISKEKIE